jgi:hypothetical protein
MESGHSGVVNQGPVHRCGTGIAENQPQNKRSGKFHAIAE